MLSGYEETMISHEKVMAKVAKKYGGRILDFKEYGNNPNTAGSGVRYSGNIIPTAEPGVDIRG